MKILHLILKRKWFEMIASGEKREEYRDTSYYWIRRLCFTRVTNPYVYCKLEKCCDECLVNDSNYSPDRYDTVTFQLGYQNDAPRMTFEIGSITIGTGREEWGAEPDKYYFIIRLGKRI